MRCYCFFSRKFSASLKPRNAKGKRVPFIIHVRHCSIAVMNSSFIRLWDVLEIMDFIDGQGKPVRFQLKYVTANRSEKTGGEIIELMLANAR